MIRGGAAGEGHSSASLLSLSELGNLCMYCTLHKSEWAKLPKVLDLAPETMLYEAYDVALFATTMLG